MKKSIFLSIFMMLLVVPFLKVKAASSMTVHNQADLKSALSNNEVTEIILGEDINTTEKINILRPVVIDGKGHTVKYVGTFGDNGSSDNKIWSGIYIFQVYKTQATFRNIKLTGGNAALLVNGGTIKLEGTIDVSGNGFGGIELSQGKGVTEVSHLKMDDDTKIVNTTEGANAPTLWVPDDSQDAIIEMNGMIRTINSGEELALQEVLNMFKTQENPQTGDYLGLSLLIGTIGLGTVFYNLKKLYI